MNIWYISKYASPAKYFFGTRHFYLAEEWIKTGNRVAVITSNSSHLSNALPKFKKSVFYEYINDVQTVWLNTFKSKKSSGISRIISWLHFDLKLLFFNKKELPIPEVIIVSSLSLTTVVPGWLLSKRYNCKFVFEIRDIWPLSIIVLGNYSKKNILIRILSLIEKFGYQKADLIVGTIPNLKEHVLEVIGKNKNCICIPQGISKNFYDNEQQIVPSLFIKKWIPKDKFIICYAGTINSNNPLDNLILAARQLKTNYNIHFLIMGNGEKKERIKQLANGLNNVSFPPTIPKNEINSFLKHVDVCYDSFESELAKFGLSRNKWMDYLYAEKPIICSFDGYQSILNEAKCGEFVPYNDVDKLIKRINYYSIMPSHELVEIGKNGKKFLLTNRTFDILAKQYLSNIYNL